MGDNWQGLCCSPKAHVQWRHSNPSHETARDKGAGLFLSYKEVRQGHKQGHTQQNNKTKQKQGRKA